MDYLMVSFEVSEYTERKSWVELTHFSSHWTHKHSLTHIHLFMDGLVT